MPKHPIVLSKINESSNVQQHLEQLSGVNATRRQVQTAVGSITRQLLEADYIPNSANTVLVPVLRAGLAMWPAAAEFFDYPEAILAEGVKSRQNNKSEVHFRKLINLKDKDLVILDPIIATGGTLVETIDYLQHKPVGSIAVLSCYAAPQGLDSINSAHPEVQIVAGSLAEEVDELGYLIPPTNGDIGDKLFGREEKNEQ